MTRLACTNDPSSCKACVGGECIGGDGLPVEVSDLYRGAREMEEARDAPRTPHPPDEGHGPLADDIPGGRTLNALLSATPFTAYIEYAAMGRYGHRTSEARVARYEYDHPMVARFCLVADLVLRIIVVIGILLVVALVIYKALVAPMIFPGSPQSSGSQSAVGG